MARPLYETSEHLEAEVAAMRDFSDRFGYNFEKLPIQYWLDYAVFNKGSKGIRGLVEVRCRNFSWSSYNTLIMSLMKIVHMHDYSKLGINSLILLKNLDGLWYWKFDPADTKSVRWGGRNNPRDDQDSEPVVHIHKSKFIPVNLPP